MSGALSGIIVGLFLGMCAMGILAKGGEQRAYDRGVCEYRGGRMVEGVCSKVEEIK